MVNTRIYIHFECFGQEINDALGHKGVMSNSFTHLAMKYCTFNPVRGTLLTMGYCTISRLVGPLKIVVYHTFSAPHSTTGHRVF